VIQAAFNSSGEYEKYNTHQTLLGFHLLSVPISNTLEKTPSNSCVNFPEEDFIPHEISIAKYSDSS
jgi:hypothetical protein